MRLIEKEKCQYLSAEVLLLLFRKRIQIYLAKLAADYPTKLGLQNRVESNSQKIRKGIKTSYQSGPNWIHKRKIYRPNY